MMLYADTLTGHLFDDEDDADPEADGTSSHIQCS